MQIQLTIIFGGVSNITKKVEITTLKVANKKEYVYIIV